jgi:hypothetical protein
MKSAGARKVTEWVKAAVTRTPVADIHTHLYSPAFGELLLWGIDELLVYHYLVAEGFRYHRLSYADFWALPKTRQADLIWEELFLRHSPVSEACRGVLTTLNALGLDVRRRDLTALRRWFARRKIDDHLTQVMSAAGVRSICMTNSPFDGLERSVWERGFPRDERFSTALRVDPLLISWKSVVPRLREWGYPVNPSLSAATVAQVRRFLETWTRRIEPRYLMVSLGPEFRFPGSDSCAQLMEKAVVPHCRDFGLPLALMLGVQRAVNPRLALAGDGVGLSDLEPLRNLCAGYPENKFAVTVLARENQHELCVLARKFRNVHLFGCWWFLNNPSLIEEMTRMRLEMLGLSFTPQHSDARVLDQIVYKWRHSREIIGRVLTGKYVDLAATGWQVTQAEIQRDVSHLFGGAFDEFCRQ